MPAPPSCLTRALSSPPRAGESWLTRCVALGRALHLSEPWSLEQSAGALKGASFLLSPCSRSGQPHSSHQDNSRLLRFHPCPLQHLRHPKLPARGFLQRHNLLPRPTHPRESGPDPFAPSHTLWPPCCSSDKPSSFAFGWPLLLECSLVHLSSHLPREGFPCLPQPPASLLDHPQVVYVFPSLEPSLAEN